MRRENRGFAIMVCCATCSSECDRRGAMRGCITGEYKQGYPPNFRDLVMPMGGISGSELMVIPDEPLTKKEEQDFYDAIGGAGDYSLEHSKPTPAWLWAIITAGVAFVALMLVLFL